MITEQDWAYLAGIIDGEGSIILHQNPKDRRVWGEIQISNTDEELVSWLIIKFGGRLYIASQSRKKSHSLGKKRIYLLRWNGKLSRDLIPRLLPYLIIKRDKAILLLKLSQLSRPQISSIEHKEKQDMIYQEFVSMAREKTGKELGKKE